MEQNREPNEHRHKNPQQNVRPMHLQSVDLQQRC
jgi:hypothetical protein